MKTTIDLPDDLLTQAEVFAARHKTTLRELVIQGLERVTAFKLPDPGSERRARAQRLIAALSRGRNTEPVGRLNRDELHDRRHGQRE